MSLKKHLYEKFKQAIYIDRGMKWERSDEVIWKFWFFIFPYLVLIPLFFWLFKYLFITYLLEKKGIGYMIAYAIIIVVMKPIVMDVIHKVAGFSKEIEGDIKDEVKVKLRKK